MKGHRETAFEELLDKVTERGQVKAKDVHTLEEIVTKRGRVTEKGAARIALFRERFKGKFSKDAAAAMQELLAAAEAG